MIPNSRLQTNTFGGKTKGLRTMSNLMPYTYNIGIQRNWLHFFVCLFLNISDERLGYDCITPFFDEACFIYFDQKNKRFFDVFFRLPSS